MDEPGKNSAISKPKVLIAPLSWGIGHATRCIPIIRELAHLDCEVLIAAEGKPAQLLKNEFPHLAFLTPPPLNISYSSSKRTFFLSLLISIPRIITILYIEHKWVKKVAWDYKIDVIISDNRPAFYDRRCRSVYITHQLHVKTNHGKWMDKLASFIHKKFINHYNACWVPDFDGEVNLAGELSQNHSLIGTPVRYLGCLSRFEKKDELEQKYRIAAVISGPEPQRTIFEEILLVQLKAIEGKKILVRGLPGTHEPEIEGAGIEIINHAGTERLSEIIQQSELIISRSGYTTLMDLIKLDKKALLVPTPGQPEQEYLAERMKQLNLFHVVEQDRLSLQFDIEKAINLERANYFEPASMAFYKRILREFISEVKNSGK